MRSPTEPINATSNWSFIDCLILYKHIGGDTLGKYASDLKRLVNRQQGRAIVGGNPFVARLVGGKERDSVAENIRSRRSQKGHLE